MDAVPPRLADRPLADVSWRLLVPGRANPVSGRPLLDVGRTAWLGAPPEPVCAVIGRDSDVPGRATCAVSCSSSSMSAMPSSSISVSSTQNFSVSARHLRYHVAWS
uniref:Uncharacterized protein n=1 Tax=Chlamydomonas euryale TaxID=1486919 RepID=A0A7R9V3K1_9CHLO